MDSVITSLAHVRERRIRMVRAKYEEVIFEMALAIVRKPTEYLSVPVLVEPALPRDAIVLSVHNNYAARTLDFAVAHPMFVRVPDGEMPPEYGRSGAVFGRQEYQIVRPAPDAPPG